jgi:anti-sigma factor RsiW
MDAKIARYIDGDLTDQEAKAFLESIESDPALEKELRDYEQVLLIGGKLSAPEVPSGFTGRVMARVTDSDRPQDSRSFSGIRIQRDRQARPGLFSWRWPSFALAAAVVALAYFGGWWFGHNMSDPAAPAGESPGLISSARPGTSAGTIQPAAATSDGLHYVRLVYVPSQNGVDHVHVAGSFNGWDSQSTPLRQQNGVWSTILVLAPGSYEYMFVEDGDRWVTDPLAVRTRDDGFGGANAVLDVEI